MSKREIMDIKCPVNFHSNAKRSKRYIESWVLHNLEELGNCYIGTNVEMDVLKEEMSQYKSLKKVKIKVLENKDCILEVKKHETNRKH